MITIATVPKAFTGQFDTIQRNALASWHKVMPQAEILLFGDDDGVLRAASDFNAKHLTVICKNGIPLLDSVLYRIQKEATYGRICFINTDIILSIDFVTALDYLPEHSLGIGRRIDIIGNKRHLHGKSGLDYFVFPRGLYNDVPPFLIGRYAWDNWMVYEARVGGYPVIDTTKVITALHQNHSIGNHNREDINENLLLARGHCFSLDHATHKLTKEGHLLKTHKFFIFSRIKTVLNFIISFFMAIWFLIVYPLTHRGNYPADPG